jgi:hypothetical protein
LSRPCIWFARCVSHKDDAFRTIRFSGKVKLHDTAQNRRGQPSSATDV